MSLSVHSVSVEIGRRPILRSVSLDVATGSTVAVVGPSGVGKSTLLKVIAGIIHPTSGSVWIDGVDVTQLPPHRRHVGMVFQDDQLFPHLSVARNVSFGLEVRESLSSRLSGLPKFRRRMTVEHSQRVDDMLALVGLEGLRDRSPMTLSGGEAKRVALARALAPSPTVLLLDEPLTGLDRELHDRLMRDLGRILEVTGTTAVLVTHDTTEADFLARHALRLEPPSPSPTGSHSHV